MKKSEMVQIITLLAGNYESIANKSKAQRELMLNTWQECLGDLEYNLVLKAVKKSIIQSPYPPTIHEIRKNVIDITTPAKRSVLEEWNECYQMICSGTYMTQEEFNAHSEICKKFLGSINQLRAYSQNEDFNMDVVRSNFFKQYEILEKRENEQKLLPNNWLDITKQLSEKMCIKQIGE